MGSCFSSPALSTVSVPLPVTSDGWARVGLPALVEAYTWLTRQQQKGSAPVKTRLRVWSGRNDGAPYEDVEEDAASLRDVRVSLKRMALTPRPHAETLASAAFLRAVAFCAANARVLAACPLTYRLKVRLCDLHTLVPEIIPERVQELLRVFRDIDVRQCGQVTDVELDRWITLRGEKVQLTESVFWPLLWKASSLRSHKSMCADEFVTAVDRLCTLTEDQLRRMGFWSLACVGKEPGATPFIAVSSLPYVFRDFRNAARDGKHVSRKLLEILRERSKQLARSERPAARLQKEIAFEHLLQQGRNYIGAVPATPVRADASDSEGDSSSAESEEEEEEEQEQVGEEGAGVERRRQKVRHLRRPLVLSSSDLLSYDDFLHVCNASGYALFDLTYLQVHFRSCTLGTRWWEGRMAKMERHRREHGAFTGKGRLTAWGYDEGRFEEQPEEFDPAIDVAPPTVRVEPLMVTRGAAWAMQVGDDAPLSPPADARAV
jgi:hypothetical protein